MADYPQVNASTGLPMVNASTGLPVVCGTSGIPCCQNSSGCCCVSAYGAQWNCSTASWDVRAEPYWISFNGSSSSTAELCPPTPLYYPATFNGQPYNASNDACNASSGFWNTWYGSNNSGGSGCFAQYFGLYQKSNGSCGVPAAPGGPPGWTPTGAELNRCCGTVCPCGAECPCCLTYGSGPTLIRCCYSNSATILGSISWDQSSLYSGHYAITGMTGIPHSAGPDGGCNTFQVSSGTITITGTGTALDGTWPLVADYISTFSIISINSFDPVNGPLSWDLTNIRFDIGDGADHFVALPNLPGDCMGIGPLVAYTDSNSAFTNITGSITVIDPVDCSEEDYYPP